MKEKKSLFTKETLAIYTRAALRYPWLVAAIFVTAAAFQIFALVSPLYLRQFFNLLARGTGSPAVVSELYGVLAIIVVLLVANWIVARIHFLCITYIDARVMRDLYEQAFRYLLRHSYHFFANQFAGTLTRRIGRFSKSYETIFDAIVMQLFPAAFFIVGAAIVLWTSNAVLGSVFALWIAFFLAVQLSLVRRNNPLRAARAAEDSRMTGALADAIGNQTTVTVFSGATFEDNRFHSVARRWYESVLRIWNADEFTWGILGFLMLGINIGMLYGAFHFWQAGALTLGDFVLIQSYLLTTFERLYAINREIRSFSEAFADAGEMVEILKTEHEIKDVPDAPLLKVSEGRIEFREVDFHFSEDRQVPSSFDLSIEGGEKVALVGPSGAGKTTITKLLLRLHDVTGGRILVDGTDIRLVAQDSLRDAIAFVPQEPVLFHRTLMENIRYGRRDATDGEVMEAAKQAHCMEFIERTPHGFATFVGERGIKLSGGERQRIAIARAILKDAPILILDEATSSLDSESESFIQEALASLMRGKTVIAIAHRLSTVMKMNRIVVIENGKVAMTGTHQELVRHEGSLYKKLWEIQAGGFIADDTKTD
jgi:ATP-binding cassette subfamily B protein